MESIVPRVDVEISESAARAAQDIRVGVGRLRRRFRDVTGSDQLTPSQTSVLSRIAKQGPMTASDLAAAERVRPQSAATWLTVLGERGLVERRPDPDDGRRRLVSLTDAGRQWVESRRRTGEEWLARTLQDRFTEDERRSLIAAMELLERLVEP